MYLTFGNSMFAMLLDVAPSGELRLAPTVGVPQDRNVAPTHFTFTMKLVPKDGEMWSQYAELADASVKMAP